MIKKRTPGRRQRDAARATREERGADFQLEIAQLPAERRLRGVQPLLGGDGETAFLRDRDEISKVAKLHAAIPNRHGSWTHKVFFLRPSPPYLRARRRRFR